MTKKSALTMAFGLALALMVGVAAISLTLGGTSVANATRQDKPIVKHQVQTVTVHRKSDAPSTSGGVRIVHLSSSSGMTQTTSGFSDDSFENEGSDDSFESGSTSGGFQGDD